MDLSNHIMGIEGYVERYLPMKVQTMISETCTCFLSKKDKKKLDDYTRAKLGEFREELLVDKPATLVTKLRRTVTDLVRRARAMGRNVTERLAYLPLEQPPAMRSYKTEKNLHNRQELSPAGGTMYHSKSMRGVIKEEYNDDEQRSSLTLRGSVMLSNRDSPERTLSIDSPTRHLSRSPGEGGRTEYHSVREIPGGGRVKIKAAGLIEGDMLGTDGVSTRMTSMGGGVDESMASQDALGRLRGR